MNGSRLLARSPGRGTGARMIVTTMYELRRRGGGIGVASMCAGGGMGSATVFEVYPRAVVLATEATETDSGQQALWISRSTTERVARS